MDGAKKDPNLNVQKAVVSKPTNEKEKNTMKDFPNKSKGNLPPKRVNKRQVKGSEQQGGVALPTALLTVHGQSSTKNEKNVEKKEVRAFFDSGSQCSFIHPDLVEQLKLKTSRRKEVTVIAFGGDAQNISCSTVRVKVYGQRSRLSNRSHSD